MTTEELLWNAAFEDDEKHADTSYNYEEEWAMERYYEDKELFERFASYLRPTG